MFDTPVGTAHQTSRDCTLSVEKTLKFTAQVDPYLFNIQHQRTFISIILSPALVATSIMDPNCDAAAAHEPNRGARCLGLALLVSVPVFWAPKRHLSNNRCLGGMHGSWMAAAHWLDAKTNRTMVFAVGGELEKRCGWTKCVGRTFTCHFRQRFEGQKGGDWRQRQG